MEAQGSRYHNKFICMPGEDNRYINGCRSDASFVHQLLGSQREVDSTSHMECCVPSNTIFHEIKTESDILSSKLDLNLCDSTQTSAVYETQVNEVTGTDDLTVTSMRFPRKLWKIVNECTTGAIGWTNNGKSIYLDYKKFQQDYLTHSSPVFKTNHITSFIRQLNLYGFKKIPLNNILKSVNCSNNDDHNEMHEFQNEYFLKGRPDLLSHVTRKPTPLRMADDLQMGRSRRPAGKSRLLMCQMSCKSGKKETNRRNKRKKGNDQFIDEIGLASDYSFFDEKMYSQPHMFRNTKVYRQKSNPCFNNQSNMGMISDIASVLDPTISPTSSCIGHEDNSVLDCNLSLGQDLNGFDPTVTETIYEILLDEDKKDFTGKENLSLPEDSCTNRWRGETDAAPLKVVCTAGSLSTPGKISVVTPNKFEGGSSLSSKDTSSPSTNAGCLSPKRCSAVKSRIALFQGNVSMLNNASELGRGGNWKYDPSSSSRISYDPSSVVTLTDLSTATRGSALTQYPVVTRVTTPPKTSSDFAGLPLQENGSEVSLTKCQQSRKFPEQINVDPQLSYAYPVMGAYTQYPNSFVYSNHLPSNLPYNNAWAYSGHPQYDEHVWQQYKAYYYQN